MPPFAEIAASCISGAKIILLRPLVARELKWEADGHLTIKQLDDDERYHGGIVDTAEEDNAGERWRGTTQHRFTKYNISVTDTNQVRLTRQVPWYTRFILLAAFFIGLEQSLDGSLVTIITGFVFWHFIIPLSVSGMRSVRPPIPACTELVVDKTHPLPRSIVLIGAGIFTIQFVTSLSVLSAHISAVVILGVEISLIGLWFRQTDDKITGENTETVKIFNIPATISVNTLATSFISISFIILAGIIGGSLPEDTVVTTDFYAVVVPIAVGITIFFFISFLSRSTQVRRRLGQARLRPFRSPQYQLATAILFLTSNLLSFGISAVMLGVLAYGITGNVYAPAYLLAPLINSVFASADVSAVSVPEFLQATYFATDSAFQAAPIGPPRVYSLAYVAILSWPFLFIGLGTIAGLLRRPYRVLSVLARSQPLKPDSGQQLLPDDIEIRQIDKGANLKPATLLFGWRKYVIVSDVIVDQFHTGNLDTASFEAIVRHEEYHLRERHYTILAACLGPFIGGRNALLAFKDYRASEDRADKYAIRQIDQNQNYENDGEDALKLGLVNAMRTNSEDVLLRGTQGIVRRAPIDEILTSDNNSDDDSDADDDRLPVRASRWLSSRLGTTYDLYFGGSLVNTAHLERHERLTDERFDRLTSEDNN